MDQESKKKLLTQFVIGAIVTCVISILLCRLMKVSIPRMIYTVPFCTIVGAIVWLFFSWLARVAPFLESFSENSSWFVNFIWTYVGKPIFYSALASYLVISACQNFGGTKNSTKKEKNETKNEETGMYRQFSDDESLAFVPAYTSEFTFIL